MDSDKCDLRGTRGIERLERVGPYSVIADKVLHQEGRSSRYAVVTEREAWVDSVSRFSRPSYTRCRAPRAKLENLASVR